MSLGAAGDEAGAVLRWKKPKILFCCFADCDAEDVDFWSLGTRGVAISLPSMPRAMVNLVESGMSRQWLTTEKWSTRLRFGERARVRVPIWRVSEMAGAIDKLWLSPTSLILAQDTHTPST